MFGKKIVCCSCSKKVPANEIRTTHHNGKDLPLCRKCWSAAKQVQAALFTASRADAARDRYQRRNSG